MFDMLMFSNYEMLLDKNAKTWIFQETSFSLYQQLVPPGGLRLRGGEREPGRKVTDQLQSNMYKFKYKYKYKHKL